MKTLTKIALVVGALALTACTDAGRFGGGADGGAGSGSFVAGSPSDPTSPAYFSQTIGDRVLFAVDQSTLSPEAQQILAQQAVWLADNPEYTATIEGHADEQGTREYNIALSERRANAVRNYLVDRGVAPNRLSTVGWGKARPIAICSDETCYSQNRRAVTVLAAGLSG